MLGFTSGRLGWVVGCVATPGRLEPPLAPLLPCVVVLVGTSPACLEPPLAPLQLGGVTGVSCFPFPMIPPHTSHTPSTISLTCQAASHTPTTISLPGMFPRLSVCLVSPACPARSPCASSRWPRTVTRLAPVPSHLMGNSWQWACTLGPSKSWSSIQHCHR